MILFLTLLFYEISFKEELHRHSTFFFWRIVTHLFVLSKKDTTNAFNEGQHQSVVLVFLRWGLVKCES